MLRFPSILVASSVLLAACGGENFEIASPPADTGADETAHSEDGGSDSTPSETCAPNACGGCATLAANVGDSCGCGDGKWACDGTDAVKCIGATSANACGGCAMLPAAVGAACGACGDGAWACDGPEALKCNGARALNACGGCATLANAPGASCGACAGGTYACDGKEATKCTDPVATAPGSTCGTCGTSTYVCAMDGKSTVCAKPDDRNACGGCGTLAGAPGAACGSCGVWTCSTDKASVSCREATPAVATSCGVCMKSKFVCASPGTTSCAMPDDRKLVEWGPTSTTVGAIAATSGARAIGVSMPITKNGMITGVKVFIARTGYDCPNTYATSHPDPNCDECTPVITGGYACSPRTPKVGTVTARVLTGPVLGSVMSVRETSIPADDPSLATPGWVEFKFATPHEGKTTDVLYFELESNSSVYKFQWNSTPYTGGPQRACTRQLGVYSFACEDGKSRPAVIVSNTCDY